MSTEKTINFMGEPQRKIVMWFSLFLTLVCFVSFFTQGFRFGLDFTGGTSLELEYSQAPNLDEVRKTLADGGYPAAVVVNFGGDNGIMVRVQSEEANNQMAPAITELLRKSTSSEITVKKAEYVGPQVGEELLNAGGLGILLSFFAVFAYVGMRFQMKFALGSLLALAHDVVLTLGLFSIFQLDFDLTVLAAVLTIIGFSINDSIVVADRIRENLRMMRDVDVLHVINVSITQTLDRTIMTSGTAIISVLAMFFFGGDAIHNFSLALIFGMTVGTYSSVYIASGLLITLKVTREDLIPAERAQGEEVDEMP
jgi:preprotein translocase subunit SecF